jgi:hypothetical protein
MQPNEQLPSCRTYARNQRNGPWSALNDHIALLASTDLGFRGNGQRIGQPGVLTGTSA